MSECGTVSVCLAERPGEGRPDGKMWGVRRVGRGWRQLGRINDFSLSVFACVAIPAQMKEIQIVIDSRRGESMGMRLASIQLHPAPSPPLGPHSHLHPTPQPLSPHLP